MNGQNGNGTNSKRLVPTQTFWYTYMSEGLCYRNLQHLIVLKHCNLIHWSTAKHLLTRQVKIKGWQSY
jgi:hypothetical protein